VAVLRELLGSARKRKAAQVVPGHANGFLKAGPGFDVLWMGLGFAIINRRDS